MGGKAMADSNEPLWRPLDEPTPLIWLEMPGVPPSLAPADLHLWRIRTDGRGMPLEQALTCLGPDQQARLAAMRHAGHRERSIRAQAGLRTVLSRYLGGQPKTLKFRLGPAGKPYLADAADGLYFNLSTSGDLALVGVSAGNIEAELGIDCEKIRPRPDMLAVARRMFDPDILRLLEDSPESERLAVFHRAWTALEADAKADGRGLFRPRPKGAIRPNIAHAVPEPGYIAAVARTWLPPQSNWQSYALCLV